MPDEIEREVRELVKGIIHLNVEKDKEVFVQNSVIEAIAAFGRRCRNNGMLRAAEKVENYVVGGMSCKHIAEAIRKAAKEGHNDSR